MPDSSDISRLVEQLSERLEAHGLMIATAESCTGGLISTAMTARAGSSRVFERGFVTYSNAAKQELLGVCAETLAQYGAVSEEVAREMAVGALENSHADIAISVTGIAGPDGGSDDKPVGLVYIGYADKNGQNSAQKHIFDGNRDEIRQKTAIIALETIILELKG